MTGKVIVGKGLNLHTGLEGMLDDGCPRPEPLFLIYDHLAPCLGDLLDTPPIAEKPDRQEVRRQNPVDLDKLLRPRHVGMIVEDEGNVPLDEGLEQLRLQECLVSRLDGEAEVRRKRVDEGTKAIKEHIEGNIFRFPKVRELKDDGSEFPPEERKDTEIFLHQIIAILEEEIVGDLSDHLGGEEKIVRRLPGPVLDHPWGRGPVVGGVHFHGAEPFRVEGKEVTF